MHGHPDHPRRHARAYVFAHGGASCCCGEPMAHHYSDCCHSGPIGHHESDCCEMGFGTGFHRRFVSREEKIARLEGYLANLQAEARAVEEKLTKLRRSE